MPRYTDGVDWFDCVENGGLHFTVTAAGKIAVVELCSPVVINPPGDVVECGPLTVLEVTELESERSCYDESTERCLHVFDLYLDDAPPVIFCAFVSGRRIRSITRYN